jgi:hypothetical protein
MTHGEEQIWRYLMRNPGSSVEEIAVAVGINEKYVQQVLDKSGSAEPERVRLLKKGIELTAGDRDKTYGPPWDNLTACAMVWEAYLSAKLNVEVRLVAEDVAHMMALVKMTRSFHGSYHDDNYLDAAVYMAIAGECRKYEERE